jgi:hypothetical protein
VPRWEISGSPILNSQFSLRRGDGLGKGTRSPTAILSRPKRSSPPAAATAPNRFVEYLHRGAAKQCDVANHWGSVHLIPMNAKAALLEEIEKQPEPVLREVLHYLKHVERQRADDDWADVLPGRPIEQEIADILDGHVPAPR